MADGGDMQPQGLSPQDRQHLLQMGVPAQQLPAGPLRPRRTALLLWRALWPAVQLCELMATQMRVAAGPGGLLYLGLDYAALPPVQAALGLPRRGPAARQQLGWLQVLEDETVRQLNDAQGRQPLRRV